MCKNINKLLTGISLCVQIKYLGANDFTGGMTWIQVPVSAFEPPEGLVQADYRTKCAPTCVPVLSYVATAVGFLCASHKVSFCPDEYFLLVCLMAFG